MLDQAKINESLKIPFGGNYVKHAIVDENEGIVKALNELKKNENKGFILVKNSKNNYIGKIFLSDMVK